MKYFLFLFFLGSTHGEIFSQTTSSVVPGPKTCACETGDMRIQYEWNVEAGQGCISGKAFNAVKKTYNAAGPGVRKLISTEVMDAREVQRICAKKEDNKPPAKGKKKVAPTSAENR